ncbi:ethylbenzene dehydrogenase-related protein [Thiothrix eikelboomii]|uniref:ethylbenzene dehydrogenase-related protein n=1 Tax=Thiothrix eikelboomii TaxID=92487 RepID=UPI003BAF8486
MRVVLPALLLAVSTLILIPAGAAELPTIPILKLESKPVLDGSEDDWQAIPAVEIPLVYLGKPEWVKTVRLKAGIFGDEVFFYSEWEDSTADTQHKPHVWDAAQQKYLEGPQREDRFALEFAMTGDYDANWFSGKEFKADMWNWKAARTNPIHISHDKMTILSRQAMPESYKGTLPDGSAIYIQRPTDSGEEPYITKRYFKKQQDLMAKYLPRELLTKGTDDVKAKGIWKNGKWHLEQSRKLDTQQADDRRFTLGETVKGAIAVFDHDENEHHFISQTLLFKF